MDFTKGESYHPCVKAEPISRTMSKFGLETPSLLVNQSMDPSVSTGAHGVPVRRALREFTTAPDSVISEPFLLVKREV